MQQTLAPARRVTIAPALIKSTQFVAVPLPITGPIAVADILEMAGGPLALTPVSASTGAISGACDLTVPVQAALQANPDVRARLPMIPVDRRSVANAIMVWNAGWLHAGNDAGAGPAWIAIRDTVAGAVSAASDTCRHQVQTGPRIVTLAGGQRPGEGGLTTVLAIGSGQWTWQQVADTAAPATGLATTFPMSGPHRLSAANTAIANLMSLKTGEE